MPKPFASIFFLFLIASVTAQGYRITLHTPNYKTGLTYLTYYYGANIYIADSALVNEKGVAVFKNDKKLPPRHKRSNYIKENSHKLEFICVL